MDNFELFSIPMLANGSGIHIKKENRGKFTETKRRTGKTTEELTHSKKPLTRKRAIFAQNSRKFKHMNGGNIYLVSNCLNFIGLDSKFQIIKN